MSHLYNSDYSGNDAPVGSSNVADYYSQSSSGKAKKTLLGTLNKFTDTVKDKLSGLKQSAVLLAAQTDSQQQRAKLDELHKQQQQQKELTANPLANLSEQQRNELLNEMPTAAESQRMQRSGSKAVRIKLNTNRNH